MVRVKELHCCGIKELGSVAHRANEWGDAMKDILAYFQRRYDTDLWKGPFKKIPARFLMFTQATGSCSTRTYGEELKVYILENKLGTVEEVAPAVNPNSGNTIKIFMWNVDSDALIKWGEAQNFDKDARNAFWTANAGNSYYPELVPPTPVVNIP